MELEKYNDVDSIVHDRVDTYILTLPSLCVDDLNQQLMNPMDSEVVLTNDNIDEDDIPSSSSLVRSECGQLFLVTYDDSKQIVSKHCINLKIAADELGELKNADSDNAHDSALVSSHINQIDDTVHTFVATASDNKNAAGKKISQLL